MANHAFGQSHPSDIKSALFSLASHSLRDDPVATSAAFSHCCKILDSHPESNVFCKEDRLILDRINSRLARQGRERDAVRVTELVQRLEAMGQLSNRPAILYFLFLLGGSSASATDHSASSTVLSSLRHRPSATTAMATPFTNLHTDQRQDKRHQAPRTYRPLRVNRPLGMNSSSSGVGLSSGLDGSTMPWSSDESARLPDGAEGRTVVVAGGRRPAQRVLPRAQTRPGAPRTKIGQPNFQSRYTPAAHSTFATSYDTSSSSTMASNTMDYVYGQRTAAAGAASAKSDATISVINPAVPEESFATTTAPQADVGVPRPTVRAGDALFKPYEGTAEVPGPMVCEATLVRDLIFVFQGIDGHYIKYNEKADAFRVDPKAFIPASIQDQAHKLAELGWLYKRLRRFVDEHSKIMSYGLVGQSFCAALSHELTEYYRLIAVLERQQVQPDDVEGLSSGGLTLTRLRVWAMEPMKRLMVLVWLVSECQDLKGGSLAGIVYNFSHTSDPDVLALMRHLLIQVALPLRHFLDSWIYDGELEDRFHEFFVAEDVSVPASHLWAAKYSLRKSVLPPFIPLDLAEKILLIGKSINFLRHLCNDRTQLGLRPKQSSVDQDVAGAVDLIEGCTMGGRLRTTVEAVYQATSQHLLNTLHQQYKLSDHLKAMRRYLLLGQGDFIRHLMDLLLDELARPATTLFLHNLIGTLDVAVRATNAQFEEPDTLERLDVKLLEVSSGDVGWDVFSLDYHVDGPIRTVFDEGAMLRYLRIFNFLWRAKRMSYILSALWTLQTGCPAQRKVIPELKPLFHKAHLLSSRMIHFMQQMEYYINFEVLECTWAELQKKVEAAKDLDEVIAAHNRFLDDVTVRCLLTESSQDMLTKLRAIFDEVVRFQKILSDLNDSTEEEIQARRYTEKLASQRSKKGEWGLTAMDSAAAEERERIFLFKTLPMLRSELTVRMNSYEDMVKVFLSLLSKHPDLSLRSLSFRLNFSNYYPVKVMRASMGFRGRPPAPAQFISQTH
ncbi:gamma-tubulin complex component 3-like isoform X1 [Sycon ciliatum]|uniref:gamma-tubulin complex component 3-like isoform X1 n=1 Tax=Sycon ciliatum TaxID=27933 RepID=UPI0031F61925